MRAVLMLSVQTKHPRMFGKFYPVSVTKVQSTLLHEQDTGYGWRSIWAVAETAHRLLGWRGEAEVANSAGQKAQCGLYVIQYSLPCNVLLQVNDFAADAIISQLLLLDSQDATKVRLKCSRGQQSALAVSTNGLFFLSHCFNQGTRDLQ